MGRRCLLTSWIGVCLGTWTISVFFQDKRKELLRKSKMGGAKRSAFSFKSYPRILSGPCALARLIEHKLSNDR